VEHIADLLAEVVAGLRTVGYDGPYLEQNYKFRDWFTPAAEEREVAAAAFGQTPISYDSALIGVVCTNGFREHALVNKYRALGAPILLEIDRTEIREWAVSRTENDHGLVERYSADQIGQMFVNRAPDWRRDSLLRAKNIGSFHWSQQLGLFSGLLPELEEHIQGQLDPLLRDALATTRKVYQESTKRDADPTQLFKLVFWILAAKVFCDRRVNGFDSLGHDPDELIGAVAKQYGSEVPKLLNREARQAAVDRIWNRLDFRNLSVEVLAQLWSTTLVDTDTKKRLGIHRTSRTLVRYIIEHILPFSRSGDDNQIILEPCSGSAVFLIGAMNFLREKLFGMSPRERHNYFIRHLAAIEKDPFGAEISRLALTLADFPNPGGWDIAQKDVFDLGVLTPYLRQAGVVLCNPPFEDFTTQERRDYQPASPKKPVELLQRVLDDLRPTGVIGFVLPQNFIDGLGYAPIRRRLAERFGTLDLTLLPDRAFETDAEVALLIALDPIPHRICRVTNRKVDDDAIAWKQFELEHKVSADHVAEFSGDQAEVGLVVPELPDVWDFLISYPKLDDFATLGRGIEWSQPLTRKGTETGHRSLLVRSDPANGYRRGVAPRTKFTVFQTPPTLYLNVKPEFQRGNAWRREWDRPKAIVNKARRSRRSWKMAAFPDSKGLVFYQTYIGVWPESDRYDEFTLSAILNSPVANAFVATREGSRDITIETLRLIPVPHFTESQRETLRVLIQHYQNITGLDHKQRREPHYVRAMAAAADTSFSNDADHLLKRIDALVLGGYRMPPRLERQLLDFFRGHPRPTSHEFSEYIPADCDVYFSLSEYLSPEFKAATTGELLKRMAEG
jgi:hypothetical protein